MKVRITWNYGFGWEVTEATREYFRDAGIDETCSAEYDLTPVVPVSDHELLELLFEATNLYDGLLWEQMDLQGLPPNRSHTALSVGDVVEIEGKAYRCVPIGWSQVVKVEYADGGVGTLSVPSDPPDRSTFDAVMDTFDALGAFDVVQEQE